MIIIAEIDKIPKFILRRWQIKYIIIKSHQLYFTNMYINVLNEAFHCCLQ